MSLRGIFPSYLKVHSCTSDSGVSVPSHRVSKIVKGQKIWNLFEEMGKKKTFKHDEKMELLEQQNIFLVPFTWVFTVTCFYWVISFDHVVTCHLIGQAIMCTGTILLGMQNLKSHPHLPNQKRSSSGCPVICMHINI